MSAPVLVTRVRSEAEPWLQALAQAGVAAELWPLIDIGPAPDPHALHEAWQQAPACAALMFVSANAVRHFFAAAPAGAGALSGPTPRFWVTGPGTRRALIDCGCDPARIDAPDASAEQFDSEALWKLVSAQVRPGAVVCIVRGGDAQGQLAGRDWLAGRLAAAGVQVRQVVAYIRRAPDWTDAQRDRLQRAASDGSIWWFSSGEAIAHLQAALPGQSWAQAHALTTHPRIAEAAHRAGFGRVVTCRAHLPELLASIESFA